MLDFLLKFKSKISAPVATSNFAPTSALSVSFLKVEGVKPPSYATDGAAAFDFYSNHDAVLNYGSPAVIGTGLKLGIPDGYGMFIFSRSGHGFKENIRLANCVGIIDSDYRGELMIKLTMDFPSWQTTWEIKKGDRIAQGILLPTPKVHFVKVETLDQTLRGESGLGSTGNQ